MPTTTLFQTIVHLRRRCFCRARAVFVVFVLTFVLMLAGCHAAPTSKPPSLAERQLATLKSLGFKKGDDAWLLNLPEPISFEFGKSLLKPSMRRSIAGFADQLLQVEIKKLRVEGHSDNVGPRPINIDLSQRRAEAVAQEFIGHGFADQDIQRVGFGPDHPMSDNDTRDGRAQNRRVEIIVLADATVLTP